MAEERLRSPALHITAERTPKSGPKRHHPLPGRCDWCWVGSDTATALPPRNAGNNLFIALRHVPGIPHDPTVQRGGDLDRVITTTRPVSWTGEMREVQQKFLNFSSQVFGRSHTPDESTCWATLREIRLRFAACRAEEMASFRQPYPRSFKCKTTRVRPVGADHNLMTRHKEICAVALYGGDIRGVVRWKVKVKFTLLKAMKAQEGSTGIALLFL